MSIGKFHLPGPSRTQVRKAIVAATDRNGYECSHCSYWGTWLELGGHDPSGVALAAAHIRRDHEPACS